jgi:hypothetical protein
VIGTFRKAVGEVPQIAASSVAAIEPPVDPYE